MTSSRTINYQLTATSNIDSLMSQITSGVQNLGSVSAAQIPKLAKELANAQTAATKAATATVQYEQALSGLSKQASSAASGGGLLQTALGFASGGAILNTITAVGKGLLDTSMSALTLAGDLKQSRIGFEQLLGGATAADAELKALRELANSTDLQFKPLQAAAEGLIAVGFNGKAAVSTIRQVADTVAAYGKGQDEFNRISLAMEQVHSRGKLLGDDARQFESVGLPIWRVLGDYLHTDAQNAQELSTQGKISAATFEAAFAQNAAQFQGAAEKASHSFNGLLSTLGDVGQTLLTDVGGPITDALEPILQRVVNLLSDPKVEATIKTWGTAIGQTITQVWQLGETIAGIFGLQLPQVTTATNTTATAAGAVAERWNTISVTVGDVKEQTQTLKDSEDGIKAGAEATSRAYDSRIQKLRDAGTALERQYTLEDQIYKLHHLDDLIGKNQLLGKNIFTDTGRTAALEAEREGEEKNQLVREMGRTAAKNANADAITDLERQKKAAAQAAQDQIAGIERSIKGIQREAQAYDDYNKAKAAAIQSYQQQQDQATRAGQNVVQQLTQVAATVQSALGGQAAGSVGPLNGLLTQLNDKSTAIRDIWNDVAGAFSKAGDVLGPLGDNLDRVVNSLGGKGGMAGVLTEVSLDFEQLMRSIEAAGPPVLQNLGHFLQITGDQASQAAAGLSMFIEVNKLITNPGDKAQQAAAANATAAFGIASHKIETDNADWKNTQGDVNGAWRTRIDAINADINARRNAEQTRLENQQAARNTRGGGSFGQQEIVVGVDPNNGNLTAAMRNMLRTHPELLDIETGAR